MLCWYSSCSKDSFDSLRLEHWKSFSVYHWEVGLFGWGLFWGYCYLQRLQAKSMLWLFFLSFSMRQLWLELQWFCSLWECCCYCGVPLCQSSGVERVGTMQYSDGCSVKVTSAWMPGPRVSHFYLSLVSWTSGVVDFYYGMVWRFHLDWIIPFSICKQSKSLSH